MAQASLQTSARAACWRQGTWERAVTQAAQLGNIGVRQTDLAGPCCTMPSHAFLRPWKVSLFWLLSPTLSHFLPLSRASLFFHVLCHLPFPVPPACPAAIRDKPPTPCLLPQSSYQRRSRRPALPPQGAVWEGALSIVKGLR